MTVVVDFTTRDQHEALAAIHARSFDQAMCAALARRLEAPLEGDLHFTARVSGVVLGHALVERVTIDRPDRPWSAPVLKAVAVDPGQRLRGIGSMLLVIAAEEARADRELAMFAWGSTAQLRRIGFVPAARFGIDAGPPRRDGELMLRPLFRRRRIPEHGRACFRSDLIAPDAAFPEPPASWAGLRRERG